MLPIYHSSRQAVGKDVISIECDGIVTGNQSFRATARRMGSRHIASIYETRAARNYKALAQSFMRETSFPANTHCVTCEFVFGIPASVFSTKDGRVRKKNDCVNLVKPLEDAIEARIKDLSGSDYNDGMVTEMTIRKYPVGGEKYKINVTLVYYS